jgi:hypothetical protein
MPSSTVNQIITPSDEKFFLAPQFPLQRQYEALRAFLVEEEPSGDVARRFGYSPSSFRVLCHQFRHDPQKRASFFRLPQRGPQSAPARDRVRDLAVAMRKRNLSVYDIRQELAVLDLSISINSLTVLLREEGFSRLPRRADDERPPTVKPEIAEVADIRQLDLSPRDFRTPLAGLFLFVPLLDRIDLNRVVTAARLPGSKMIPAVQALRSLLAMKLIGVERKSHVMDLVMDQAIALFAGINVVPKRSYLEEYSSSLDHKACLRLMQTWLEQVEQAGLPHGPSFDLDFHSVPANTAEEPLEKHYVSSRSRSQKGILVFLARDAEQGVMRYANAGVTKNEQADEILQFVRFWKKRTGQLPTELVFDSQLTTYGKLSELNRQGIFFITLRRRSRKMLHEIYSQPDSAWKRINLPALTRIYRNPKVLEQQVTLPGFEGELRQLTIMELGHEDPTILLTNHRKLGPVELVTRYAQRMLIENGISEAVQFFHIDALSSMVGMKVDFDMQLTLMASSLYRIMARRIGREYSHSQAKTVFRNLLDLSGKVEIAADSVVVTLDKRAHNPYLVNSGLADKPTPMPWFGNKKLTIRFA